MKVETKQIQNGTFLILLQTWDGENLKAWIEPDFHSALDRTRKVAEDNGKIGYHIQGKTTEE